MKIQIRIPATITGTTEKNIVCNAANLFVVVTLYFKAKKQKASAFLIFF